MEKALPAIPAKRYFTIGEVSELCGVKPYVLRYWEQEFTQLKPMKRRGNRRYYQHHEVLLIRRIRDLLYEQGFTISGARNRLSEFSHGSAPRRSPIRSATLRKQWRAVDKSPRSTAPRLPLSMNRSRRADTRHDQRSDAGRSCCRSAVCSAREPEGAVYNPRLRRGVAQPGSALAWGARGREFESRRPDQ